jgi:hypothetical protein
LFALVEVTAKLRHLFGHSCAAAEQAATWSGIPRRNRAYLGFCFGLGEQASRGTA